MGKKATPGDGAKAEAGNSGAGGWIKILLVGTVVILLAYVYQEVNGGKTAVSSKNAAGVQEAAQDDSKPAATKPAAPKPEAPTPKRQPKTNPYALEVPRVTVQELEANLTLRTGHHPFVLTGAMQGQWKATNWTLGSLKNKIPFEWVDYYPDNMKDLGKKPYLMTLEEAVPAFKERDGKVKYMQMRISLRGWKRLRKDFQPMPAQQFWEDDSWIRYCMAKDGKPDEDAISNFYTTNQWKFLLIGQKGTTMFFHKDHTAAGSWQAMIQGRKKWTLCPNTETHYFSTGMDIYNKQDHKRYPNFAKGLCGQVTVEPGELVYYPAYWWHQALQLDTPTIAYTGALVGTEAVRKTTRDLDGKSTKAHESFYNDLIVKCEKCWTKGQKQRHCDDISLKWPGAAPPPLRRICDRYLPRCYKLWDEHARTILDSRPAASS